MSQVLIIDDDTILRETLTDLLVKAGHVVTEAEDGIGAIDLLKAKDSAFDLIITDVVMPGENGVQVVREARVHCPAAKILAISGGSADQPARWALKMTEMYGVDRFLLKPFKNQELIDIVGALLSEPST